MNAKKLKVKSEKLKILIFLLFTLPLSALNISVTILPQKGIVEAIGGNKVNVNVMVPPGNSPATYSANFKQLKELKNSQIYFTIGVPFDKKYTNKIQQINSDIKIIDFAKFIKKDKNPHIWLSPALLMLEAKTVLDILITNDPDNKNLYLENYKKFINKLANLETKGLKEIKQKAFLTFHPSFYYFAKDFHIKQLAIQKEGKNPSFSYLAKIIKLAKKENIKTVIISPEFPTKYAKIVANKINAKVVVISPLNESPIKTINQLIEALK
jgi:zinc transport system substrate-binding protein